MLDIGTGSADIPVAIARWAGGLGRGVSILATDNHPPPIVYILMALLGVVSALLMGYATSANRDRSVLHTWVFAVILSLTFYVIIDLEFPRLGIIRVDAADQVMVDLRTSMGK